MRFCAQQERQIYGRFISVALWRDRDYLHNQRGRRFDSRRPFILIQRAGAYVCQRVPRGRACLRIYLSFLFFLFIPCARKRRFVSRDGGRSPDHSPSCALAYNKRKKKIACSSIPRDDKAARSHTHARISARTFPGHRFSPPGSGQQTGNSVPIQSPPYDDPTAKPVRYLPRSAANTRARDARPRVYDRDAIPAELGGVRSARRGESGSRGAEKVRAYGRRGKRDRSTTAPSRFPRRKVVSSVPPSSSSLPTLVRQSKVQSSINLRFAVDHEDDPGICFPSSSPFFVPSALLHLALYARPDKKPYSQGLFALSSLFFPSSPTK